jgi:transcriptional regulator with XRE-family HTH domain
MIGLEYILRIRCIEYKILSEKLCITKQNISMWVSGERNIPKKYLNILIEMLNTSEYYLKKELTKEDKLFLLDCEKKRIEMED